MVTVAATFSTTSLGSGSVVNSQLYITSDKGFTLMLISTSTSRYTPFRSTARPWKAVRKFEGGKSSL